MLFIGQPKNPKGKDLAVAALARDKKDVEPMLVAAIPLPAAVSRDDARAAEEVAAGESVEEEAGRVREETGAGRKVCARCCAGL